MHDEHLTPVLAASSEAELALLIEFLGRPPSGLLWLDRRIRRPGASHAERVAAIVEEVLRCGDHSVTGRLGAGSRSYLQLVCDALRNLELSEAPAQGVLELELRVVRYVLDSEFDRLEPALQAELLAEFLAGNYFAGGLRGYDPMHPFFTRVQIGRRVLAGDKVGRAMRKAGERELRRRAKGMIRRAALRVVLRGLAGPANWVLTAWDWLGPAYRLTVPTICYVAYLREQQAARARADASSEETEAPEATATPEATEATEAAPG